ncbi:MAG: bifunctional folylpolyglutamate synthase/dihydrofolate synthase, partial [Firmicutes bacterium]|nr:bifunctional folylpolyglutamate synthase/dihydrofolate synthase [Bacillota bacterium]
MAGVLPHLQRLDERGHWGIKLGLENPRRLLAALGHPEQRFPAVLIAGTNGKGSTGAFLAHALKACGHRIGWTTSPHLVSPTERIWIDGAPLSAEALDGFLAQAFLAEESLGIKATYFELMIASALLAFREAGVELALAEVGMGGRWDATNVLDPIVTVLTHVGLDHMAFLGETKEAIAREKLATARAGRLLVLGPSLEVDWVRPLLEVEPVLCPAPRVVAESVQWDHSVVQGHRVGLAGLHQLENLATALETLRQLQHLGWHLPDDALWRGIAQTQWPGRLWVVPGLENVWMDGAHNPDGAAVVARHAKACGVQPHLLFGAMGDK